MDTRSPRKADLKKKSIQAVEKLAIDRPSPKFSSCPPEKITQYAMKIPSRILTGAALFAAVLSPSFAQTATTKPVGYRTETIKTGVFNLLSPNLDNPVGAAGTIDVIAGCHADRQRGQLHRRLHRW
jgi:hypothetical protein